MSLQINLWISMVNISLEGYPQNTTSLASLALVGVPHLGPEGLTSMVGQINIPFK
jgi:hypothetical protein